MLVQQLLGKKVELQRQDGQRHGKGPTKKAGKSGKDEGERKSKKQKKNGPGNLDNVAKEDHQHFPLKVVKLDGAGSDENGESSDTSKHPPSSLTNSSNIDVNSGGSDNDNAVSKTVNKKKAAKNNAASSDSSSNSEGPSLSPTPNRKLLSANANLERNVRWHNQNRNTKHSGYKDDVNGAAVTANNASARLSSLQHMGSSSEEDDSGYRESNESRDEASPSSEGGSSTGGSTFLLAVFLFPLLLLVLLLTDRLLLSCCLGRRRTVAPTCNVCLIRNDLTTIWCEVTSSVRSRGTDSADSASRSSRKKTPMSSSSTSASVDESNQGPNKRSAEEANLDEEALEILLCLRPIRDGDSRSGKSSVGLKQQRVVSECNTTNISSSGDDVAGTTGEDSSGAKQAASGDSSDSMSSVHKQGKISNDWKETSGNIKDTMDDVAVESLIAMSKSP